MAEPTLQNRSRQWKLSLRSKPRFRNLSRNQSQSQHRSLSRSPKRRSNSRSLTRSRRRVPFWVSRFGPGVLAQPCWLLSWALVCLHGVRKKRGQNRSRRQRLSVKPWKTWLKNLRSHQWLSRSLRQRQSRWKRRLNLSRKKSQSWRLPKSRNLKTFRNSRKLTANRTRFRMRPYPK